MRDRSGWLPDGRLVPCMEATSCQNYRCLAVRVIEDGTSDPAVELSSAEDPSRTIIVQYHELQQFAEAVLAGKLPKPQVAVAEATA